MVFTHIWKRENTEVYRKTKARNQQPFLCHAYCRASVETVQVASSSLRGIQWIILFLMEVNERVLKFLASCCHNYQQIYTITWPAFFSCCAMLARNETLYCPLCHARTLVSLLYMGRWGQIPAANHHPGMAIYCHYNKSIECKSKGCQVINTVAFVTCCPVTLKRR